MNVILKENIVSLGKAGDTVKVSDGYARNYLVPQGLAIEANTRNLKTMEHNKQHILQVAAKERKKAEDIAQKLAGITCTIARRVGEQDKLFGSVGTKDIEKALQEAGIEIEKKNIMLDEPLKSLGEFPVRIKLPAGASAELKVNIVAEQ
ncbi:MAG: 50S ribosomal protein L9 [Deltaproteobacteria bacterium]|nr:50S ribosomal protein L9 [Deltaproteobacteria bacterium]